MTHRDLEEVISHLEYLVENDYSPAMREEYKKQLKMFRELLALQDDAEELTPAWKSTRAA